MKRRRRLAMGDIYTFWWRLDDQLLPMLGRRLSDQLNDRFVRMFLRAPSTTP